MTEEELIEALERIFCPHKFDNEKEALEECSDDPTEN